MKLVTILLFVTFMQVSAASLAQKVNYQHKNATLEQVFKEIKKQTGYNVLYSDQKLNDTKTIDADFNDAPLEEVLNKCLDGHFLTFVIEDKNILIKDRAPTVIDKIKSVFSAASANITGRVTDSASTPLIGATVILENTKFVTVTDNEGKFNFPNVPNGKYNLVVTYVGYLKLRRPIEVNGIDLTFIQLTMQGASGQLKEVVVSNGYQVLPLERTTGSYDQIDNALLNRSVSPDIFSRMVGVASGVLFNASPGASGTPLNANATNPIGNISIRGISTIQSNVTPLVILDGFPYDGNYNNINPNDIESITILKDAAASSIWGARAGNGVIVLTSKSGKFNQAVHVDFNVNFTTSQRPNLFYDPNFLDSKDDIALEEQLFANNYYKSAISATNHPPLPPVVDLLNQVQNNAITQSQANALIANYENVDVRNDLSKYFYRPLGNEEYALSVSGGNQTANYRFSTGYDNDLSNQVGNSASRITLNSVNNFTLFKNLELGADLSYTESDTKADNTLSQLAPGSSVLAAVYPYMQLADAQGNALPTPKGYSTSYVNAAPQNGFLNWQFYPLTELREGLNTQDNKSYDLRANFDLKYRILDGFTAQVQYQYEKSLANLLGDAEAASFYTRNMVNQFSVVSNGTVTGYNIPQGDILDHTYVDQQSQNIRGQLNYEHTWGKSIVSAIAGYELKDLPASSNGFRLYGYNESNGTFANVIYNTLYSLNPATKSGISSGLSTSETIQRFRSEFANVGYTYDGKYTLSGSARYDGSNLFGVNTNQKSVPLWSVGLKWDIDKEKFYHIDWLPTLKLRTSYGYSGNINANIYAFPTAVYYGIGNDGFQNLTTANLTSPGDPDLVWEKDGIWNLAIDFGTKANRITGSLEYYKKSETDLIGSTPLPISSGQYNATVNTADMKGQGYDVTINTRNLTGALSWTSNFMLSHSTDEVTKYVGTPANGYQLVIGKPVFPMYGLKSAGLDPANGNPRGYLNGQVSENYQQLTNQSLVTPSGNNFNVNSSYEYIGPGTPTYFGAFRNTFSYKGFTLSANITYKLGYYFRRSSISYSQLIQGGLGNSDYLLRWQKPGDENTTIVPSLPSPLSVNLPRDAFYRGTAQLIVSGNQIRMNDANLAYDFNKIQWRQIQIRNLKVFLYANNLGLIWKANKNGLDPDFPTGGIPNPRSLSVGLNASF